MMMYFLKKPTFMIGFSFVFLLLLASFLYEPLYGDVKWQNEIRYDENGDVVGTSPFSPAEYPPLGTDRVGVPLLAKVIQGAKYTIVTALLAGGLQVFLAFVLSIFYSHLPKFLRRGLEGVVESSLYLPASVIAYMLLMPLQFYIDPNVEPANFYKLFFVQILLLTIIGIPQLVILFAKDIQKELNQEYILASRTLGARGLPLYKTHILPFMLPRLVLQLTQRTVEILILLVHLGFLKVFLGGYIMKEAFFEESQAFSLSSEWAGEIGKSFRSLAVTPWEVYSPLLFFALTVLAFNMMANSVQEYMNSTDVRRKRKIKKKEKKQPDPGQSVSRDPFVLINKHSSN